MAIEKDKDNQRPGNPDRRSNNASAAMSQDKGQGRDKEQTPRQPK